MKLEPGQAMTLGGGGVDVHDAKALLVALLAKVHPLQAAGIGHHGGLCPQNLVFVDVAQGNVVDLGLLQVSGHQHVVLAEHHGPFGTDGGAVDGKVGGDDGGNLGVQLPGPGVDGGGHAPFHFLAHFVDGLAAGILPAQQRAAAGPRDGQDLQGPRASSDGVVLEGRANVDVGHPQGVEDLDGGGAANGVGQVVVADQQEGRDAGLGKAGQAFGELPLLGLGRVPALVGISGEQHQVYVFGQGIFNHLVEGGQEVAQPGGQASRRVGAPVVFDADVQVGEVEYAQRWTPLGWVLLAHQYTSGRRLQGRRSRALEAVTLTRQVHLSRINPWCGRGGSGSPSPDGDL